MKIKTFAVAIASLAVLLIGYFLYTGTVVAPSVTEGTPSSGSVAYINASQDLIVVGSPKPGESVGQAFSVSGSARGYWFFEASFPIEVVTADGVVIGGGVAQAEGEWMTEEFVPFKAQITLTSPFAGEAIVRLKKDNPSGELEQEASASFPVVIQS